MAFTIHRTQRRNLNLWTIAANTVVAHSHSDSNEWYARKRTPFHWCSSSNTFFDPRLEKNSQSIFRSPITKKTAAFRVPRWKRVEQEKSRNLLHFARNKCKNKCCRSPRTLKATSENRAKFFTFELPIQGQVPSLPSISARIRGQIRWVERNRIKILIYFYQRHRLKTFRLPGKSPSRN